MRQVTDNALRQEYRRRLSSIWKSRHEPAALFIYLIKCAAHYHYTKLLKDLTVDDRTLINTV
jgi:hypothetical protein